MPWKTESGSVLVDYETEVNKILGGDEIDDDVVATKTKFTVRRKKDTSEE
jgi:hypothetical protein